MRAPRSLTARLVGVVVVLVALTGVLVATTSTVVMDRYLKQRLDRDVVSALGRATDPPGTGGRPGGRDRDGRDGDSYFGQGPGTVVMVTVDGSSDGLLITEAGGASSLATSTLTRLADVPADGAAHAVELDEGHYRAAAGTNARGTRWAVALPTDDIRAITGSLLLSLLLLTLGGVALAALGGLALVRRQLKPLREVAATAEEVTEQELSTGDPSILPRVAPAHTDPRTEVGAVGHALNTLLDHMSDALAARHRSEQQVRQFVGDASHELRTPLATINGYAQLARRTPDDPTALSAALAKVETEAHRMSSLVEDLLLLARLDSGRPLEHAPVDLTRLLLESVADARVLAPAHRWQLNLPEEPVVVTGDDRRLHQVVTNLLSNARHHTPPGTTVTVSARTTGQGALIEVHDDGPGLPHGLTDHAFERFSRGDTSRARASGGAGLGLSLVAAIAQAHGGRVEVTSLQGSTTFAITLPS